MLSKAPKEGNRVNKGCGEPMCDCSDVKAKDSGLERSWVQSRAKAKKIICSLVFSVGYLGAL